MWNMEVIQRAFAQAKARFGIHPDQDGCWLCLPPTKTCRFMVSAPGYHSERKSKVCLLSRVAYAAVYGPFDVALFVCHHCDNPQCFNPAHLFLGTPADNTRDAVMKGRMTTNPHSPNWKPPPAAKLTQAQRDLIVKAYFVDGRLQEDIAAEFGCTSQNVSHLVRKARKDERILFS